ncbi:glycosyl hydrolase [Cellvibrio japonicus]|uniref:Endo-1, 4-beta mannanase, man26B n=2 Tax=Cellvibrio japonicus TaxID=155077 RepID=B3PKL2_CELJU|nr:glycosyl hydrolase [Cellvibrio japonicus]AAO31762.1 endo-b1,4-mannanase 26B [Cellvibrio japonicus]ACE85176.1 endo-1, 4-beta mannanase, man26B [Cellvibrio japonicus Ueda107]QEI12870.1 beta-mannosidase [Cellvibrio japonicus]QEI16444.1 beta-mannosidase [Cellvibrio japonicus]QEI20022.1 beta-mannosidase [Cellvibrio japonicus]
MQIPRPLLSWLLGLSVLSLLSACGGGGGGGNSSPSSSRAATTSSSTATTSSTSSSSLSSSSSSGISSSSSSSISSSSSSLSSSSSSSSSSAAVATCTVDGSAWKICTTDNGSWGFENNDYCISHSFCPANRTSLPEVATRELPVNQDASAKTRRVYSYLKSIWGSKMIAGQQDLTWKDAIDMYQRVFDDTGKYPALMGYDFMNYGMTANWVEGLGQTEEAIAHAQRGGLVTFAWHWRDPARLNTANVNSAEFYSEKTDFTIPLANGALDTSSPAYAQINAGIDVIAAELKKLGDADVPVLWRPLHEASGYNGNGWFWWGRARTDGAPQAYANILLWRHLYDRLVNYHQLDNLIWVWNGQNPAWFPGNDVADIMSFDIYDNTDNKTYKSQLATYTQVRQYSAENKMIALSENSYIPDPDKIQADNAWWLWFMTWNDGNFNATTLASGTHQDNFWSGDYYNTSAHKTHVYNHDLVITLDKLPDFNEAD